MMVISKGFIVNPALYKVYELLHEDEIVADLGEATRDQDLVEAWVLRRILKDSPEARLHKYIGYYVCGAGRQSQMVTDIISILRGELIVAE